MPTDTPLPPTDDTSPDATPEPDLVEDPDEGPTPPDVPEPSPLPLTEVLPPYGHPPGGETVAVVGDHFHGGCQVLFDGSPGSHVVFVTEQRLHVNTPPHQPGRVDVQVLCGERTGKLQDRRGGARR